jgi:hypothetical protein
VGQPDVGVDRSPVHGGQRLVRARPDVGITTLRALEERRVREGEGQWRGAGRGNAGRSTVGGRRRTVKLETDDEPAGVQSWPGVGGD